MRINEAIFLPFCKHRKSSYTLSTTTMTTSTTTKKVIQNMRRKCLSFSLRMIVIEGVCSLGIFFHKYTSIMRHKNSFFVPFSLNIGHTRFLQKNKLETFRITNNSKRKQPWDTQEKGTVLCKKMSPNHHHPHTHTCLRMYKIVRGKQFNKDPLFALCLFPSLHYFPRLCTRILPTITFY